MAFNPWCSVAFCCRSHASLGLVAARWFVVASNKQSLLVVLGFCRTAYVGMGVVGLSLRCSGVALASRLGCIRCVIALVVVALFVRGFGFAFCVAFVGCRPWFVGPRASLQWAFRRCVGALTWHMRCIRWLASVVSRSVHIVAKGFVGRCVVALGCSCVVLASRLSSVVFPFRASLQWALLRHVLAALEVGPSLA